MKKLQRIHYALSLFRQIRDNSADGFSRNMAIRWVCRYHCLVEEKGWDIRWRFQKPKSRKDFIAVCEQCLREMEWVWRSDYLDRATHYYMCKDVLVRLLFLAQRMPAVWFIVFRLHL